MSDAQHETPETAAWPPPVYTVPAQANIGLRHPGERPFRLTGEVFISDGWAHVCQRHLGLGWSTYPAHMVAWVDWE